MDMSKRQKQVLVLTFILALSGIALGRAAEQYFSETRTTTVTGYEVSINDIPEVVPPGTVLTFVGVVSFNGEPVANAPVTLFLNDVATTVSGVADGSGAYSLEYTVTEPEGTVLNFQVMYEH